MSNTRDIVALSFVSVALGVVLLAAMFAYIVGHAIVAGPDVPFQDTTGTAVTGEQLQPAAKVGVDLQPAGSVQ